MVDDDLVRSTDHVLEEPWVELHGQRFTRGAVGLAADLLERLRGGAQLCEGGRRLVGVEARCLEVVAVDVEHHGGHAERCRPLHLVDGVRGLHARDEVVDLRPGVGIGVDAGLGRNRGARVDHVLRPGVLAADDRRELLRRSTRLVVLSQFLVVGALHLGAHPNLRLARVVLVDDLLQCGGGVADPRVPEHDVDRLGRLLEVIHRTFREVRARHAAVGRVRPGGALLSGAAAHDQQRAGKADRNGGTCTESQ